MSEDEIAFRSFIAGGSLVIAAWAAARDEPVLCCIWGLLTGASAASVSIALGVVP